MKDLFQLAVNPVDLIVRAVIVYLAVLVLLRISGKRQIGQMGAVELVTILLISNAVQNSMNGGDNSLIGGIILAAALIALSMGFSRLSYGSRTFRTVFEGTPTLLIHEGKTIERAMRKELLSQSDLHVLLRKQGVHHTSDVKTAVLESDGTLSLTRFQDLASPSGAPGL